MNYVKNSQTPVTQAAELQKKGDRRGRPSKSSQFFPKDTAANMPVERRGVRALQVKKMNSPFNLNLSNTVPLTDVPCTGSVSAYLCMQRLQQVCKCSVKGNRLTGWFFNLVGFSVDKISRQVCAIFLYISASQNSLFFFLHKKV